MSPRSSSFRHADLAEDGPAEAIARSTLARICNRRRDFFAARRPIFGKVGVFEMNSDLATFLRTLVILLVTALLNLGASTNGSGRIVSPREASISGLSGIATGLSWLCYYRACKSSRSRVAPIDKLSQSSLVGAVLRSCFSVNG